MSDIKPSDTGRIRPPWWLKPMNRVFIALLRLGLPVSGGAGPVVLTVAGRCAVFRFDPVAAR